MASKMRLLVFYFILKMCSIKYNVAKNFTRCDLARELTRQDYPKNQLRTWVCIVEAESSRRTDVIGGPDEDGSYDYGLFQINDRYWCSNDEDLGKGCNVTCRGALNGLFWKWALIFDVTLCVWRIIMVNLFMKCAQISIGRREVI